MDNLYIVTGAAGNLGSCIAEKLLKAGNKVRALVLTNENCDELLKKYPNSFTQYVGNVCDKASMKPMFETDGMAAVRVIHCAGLITIYGKDDPRVYKINVGGTSNIVELCKETNVKKLVYVSSVHAIPEQPQGVLKTEVSDFDPKGLCGCYAKTKALASQIVLTAAKDGLDAVVVHPAGIIGPSAHETGNMATLIMKFIKGKLPTAVHGGYDFVDVRDVADGVISASVKGRKGECYILSNRFVSLRELFDTLAKVTGVKKLRVYLPVWFAKIFAPISELYYKLTKKTPLFTRYSLTTLKQNALFSHDKADRELGYKTRSLSETLKDTVAHIAPKRKQRSGVARTRMNKVLKSC